MDSQNGQGQVERVYPLIDQVIVQFCQDEQGNRSLRLVYNRILNVENGIALPRPKSIPLEEHDAAVILGDALKTIAVNAIVQRDRGPSHLRVHGAAAQG